MGNSTFGPNVSLLVLDCVNHLVIPKQIACSAESVVQQESEWLVIRLFLVMFLWGVNNLR